MSKKKRSKRKSKRYKLARRFNNPSGHHTIWDEALSSRVEHLRLTTVHTRTTIESAALAVTKVRDISLSEALKILEENPSTIAAVWQMRLPVDTPQSPPVLHTIWDAQCKSCGLKFGMAGKATECPDCGSRSINLSNPETVEV